MTVKGLNGAPMSIKCRIESPTVSHLSFLQNDAVYFSD